MRPRLWMKPGMMPILHWPGAIIPGQLGPTRRVLDWDLSMEVMRTMSIAMRRTFQYTEQKRIGVEVKGFWGIATYHVGEYPR